ncbi:phage major capsid protein [Thermomonas brevis]|uniref:Phage major capsid protein n=1 Tax=Thermomonas brevis TaxID=215691 RepID=A0A7G9QV24_9GAMM|nr:phage major capsid protein [Thermomonas brevis]QNN47199.1 phage major capsid protein [Thermomonas brevis]
MNLQAIREAKASKVAAARALVAKAEGEKRSLTAEESASFDTIKGEITALEADEARATFLADAERRMGGERVGGGERSMADLESRVSILSVIRAQMEGRQLTGAEAEYHAEAERRSGRKAQGILVPMRALETRVNTTTSAGQIVPTDHRPADYIQPLRNRLLARQLGVRVLSGLSGDLSIPKHGSSTTTGWVAEGSNLSASDMTFGSVGLSPKHVGGISEMSRQLIQQSSPDIEQLLRDDMAFQIAQAIDGALIDGGGTNEPVGLLSTVGIQTANLSTLSWANVLEMLEKLEIANAEAAHWLTSPQVKTKLASTLKATGIAGYLMEAGKMADLPVHVTNQVPVVTGTPDTGQLILGDWSQVLLGIWSELDILVNPFDSVAYARGGVLVRAMATVDTAVRHPKAFVVASDVAL